MAEQFARFLVTFFVLSMLWGCASAAKSAEVNEAAPVALCVHDILKGKPGITAISIQGVTVDYSFVPTSLPIEKQKRFEVVNSPGGDYQIEEELTVWPGDPLLDEMTWTQVTTHCGIRGIRSITITVGR